MRLIELIPAGMKNAGLNTRPIERIRNMQPYLKAFIVMSIVFLFQGCSGHIAHNAAIDLFGEKGAALYVSNYIHCTKDMDAAYQTFPIVRQKAYVFKESSYTETHKGKKKITIKPDSEYGIFWPQVSTKKSDDRTVTLFTMQCVADDVDVNHNRRLIEIQRCVENQCMQAFKKDDWWPNDLETSFDGWGYETEPYPLEQLAACAGCKTSEARLLAEGDHDSNFVARNLEGQKSSSPLPPNGTEYDSPFYEQMRKIGGGYSFGETRMKKFEMGDFVPRHMFDTHRYGENYRRRHLNPRGDPHLREIIFCDPMPDGSFYITDTPVLASD